MKITLTRATAGHASGTTIERSTKVAQLLIAHGAAIETEQVEPATSDDATTDETKPKRTRRSAARKGKGNADDSATTGDKTAGQEGGGTPLRSLPPTAG